MKKVENTLQTLTDEVLFSRFQAQNDKQAFEVLLGRYKGPLFSFILKSVKNRELAEELFQDVFFKIIEKRDNFRESVSFRAWAYTVCRNTCIDSVRKDRRTPLHESFGFDAEDVNFLPPVESGTQHQKSVENELNSFLEKSLKEIPKEQAETFYLKVCSELTFEEIGESMNCSVNTAKSRMRYALDSLREIFGKRGYLQKDT